MTRKEGSLESGERADQGRPGELVSCSGSCRYRGGAGRECHCGSFQLRVFVHVSLVFLVDKITQEQTQNLSKAQITL